MERSPNQRLQSDPVPSVLLQRQLQHFLPRMAWYVKPFFLHNWPRNLQTFRIHFKTGQVEKSDRHLLGDLYHQISGVSSFHCYIQCVKNPGCDFAVSSHDSECLLKKYNPRKMNLEMSPTRNETEYGEYIFIPSEPLFTIKLKVISWDSVF